MLHKCANPACGSVFRSLSRGKLFLLETENAPVISNATAPNRRERPVRHVERYWLCDLCSPLLTLIFERGRGMVTIPLPVRNTYVSAAHLMQFQPAMRGYRAERSQKTL